MSEWTAQVVRGSSWRLVNEERSIDVPFKVPGCALDALYTEGLIKDPLYRDCETEYAWVGKAEWKAIGTVKLTTEQEIARQIDLVVNGVDTCASITFNGNKLADVSNVHREYCFNVKEHIKEGAENIIEIKFKSAIHEAEAQSKKYPYPCPTVTQGVYKHYNFLRKAACDFGWDWGPGFGQCGILGDLLLRTYEVPYVTDFHVCQSYSGTSLKLHPKITINNPFKSTYSGGFIISSEQLGFSITSKITLTGENSQEISLDPISVSKPYEQWWPHDMGGQHLYKIEVAFTSSSGDLVHRPKTEKKIGLRRVELVQEPLPNGEEGESFYFKVNGIPIFAKGANMIPMDISASRVTTEDVWQLVQDARDANMNMIRVWGGGHYAPDAFYDACNELGILVWQEFMFACAMYPRDKAFLEEVRKEVKHQALRLSNHPCVVVWGGNNECEDALPWFPETRTNPPLYIVDQCKLFIDTVKTALEEVDPDVPFLDTSPSNGVVSFDPYVKRFGKVWNPQFGDVHFYNYKDNCLDYTIYPRAKFISEFGFQSYPSFSVYEEVSSPEDWSYGSKLSSFRQRHPNGNEELKAQMARHFVVPAEKDSSGKPEAQKMLFKKWIHLTQLQQALCYNTAVCYWRTLKNDPVALTRGVLYWQLNDIWQGPSWSSINYGGKWKLLHYMVKKFFSPFLVSARILANKTLEVHLVNDLTKDLRVHTEVMVIPLRIDASQQAIHLIPFDRSVVDLGAGEVKSILDLSIQSTLQSQGLNAYNCLLYIVSIGTTRQSSPEFKIQEANPSDSWLSEAVITLAPWKDVQFQDPKVHGTNYRQEDNNIIKFMLVTTSVVSHVALESNLNGKFSDNVLLLLPWSPREIAFTSKDPITIEEFKASLEVFLPVTEHTAGDWIMVDDDFV